MKKQTPIPAARRNNRGTEMLEQVMVVGFVILPMLAVLIHLKTEILNTFLKAWKDLASG